MPSAAAPQLNDVRRDLDAVALYSRSRLKVLPVLRDKPAVYVPLVNLYSLCLRLGCASRKHYREGFEGSMATQLHEAPGFPAISPSASPEVFTVPTREEDRLLILLGLLVPRANLLASGMTSRSAAR